MTTVVEKSRNRDKTIDILRGIAIITMLCANVIGYVAPVETHPIWTRFYNSIAAPLFIILAGYMVAYTSDIKGYNFNYFIKRGLLMLLTAALVDVVCWLIYPFLTYDVLYLIGFSIPLVYLFHKLDIRAKAVIILLIFAITPLLQHWFGYTYFPRETDLTGEVAVELENQTSVLQHFLIDGWFPVFPWLAFSFVGSFIKELQDKASDFYNMKYLLLSLVGVIVGFVWLYFFDYSNIIEDREGYTELFYPVRLSYVLLAISFVFFLWIAIKKIESWKVFYPAKVLGEVSLFVYILHSALIGWIIYPYFYDEAADTFIGSFATAMFVYLLLLLACFIPALILKWIKKKYKIKNYLFRFYFGG